MPESPDFEKMAHALLMIVQTAWPVLPGPHDAPVTAVVDQLRLVWNARGAADIAKLDAMLGDRGLINAANLDRALRSLDR